MREEDFLISETRVSFNDSKRPFSLSPIIFT